VSNQKHRQQRRGSWGAAVTARFATSDGGTLTLKEVASSTLYISDRPKRIAGHLTTADFVDLWREGGNRVQEDPPNAVLACLESGDDEPDDAVILIRELRPRDGQLFYSVETLEGNLPTHAAAAGAARNRRAGRKRKRRRHSCRVIAIRNERSPSWAS
jgi:hypothetical protein